MRDEDTIGSDSTFRDDFLRGAARAFFVTAYADFVENLDNDDGGGREEDDETEYPRPGPRQDWCDYAPPTPPAAFALAGELWALLKIENRETAPGGVHDLAGQAMAADGVDVQNDDLFGHYLAMQAMGHGVSWFDDHKSFPLKVPHIECSMCSFSTDAYKPE